MTKFFLLGILCSFTYTLKAQDTIYNRRLGLAVKTDIIATPVAELLGPKSQTYSLSIEKLIGKRQSFQLSGYFDYFNYSNSHNTSYRFFQIIPEFRFYQNKKNYHKGLYCGIYAGLIDKHEFIPNAYYDHKYRYIELGAISGYQIYLLKHFAVDFLFGFGAKKTISKKIINHDGLTPSTQRPYYLDGRLSLNIGYIFY